MNREEAIEIVRKLYYDSLFLKKDKEAIETLIPELKESKDERIRKDIIRYLKYSGIKPDRPINPHVRTTMKDALAWLEKQCKETSWKPSKEEMDVLYSLSYITNEFDERKEEVIMWLYQDLKRVFFNGASFENMFPTNTSEEFKKQCEQKSADKIETKQKPDMLEKGKWYVCNTARYTDFVVGKAYYCPKNGMLKPDENEMARYVARNCFRLWTIQDAKEGDVLVCENGWTCIFKTLVNDETFSSYCFMDATKWFCETGGECHTLKEEFVKAYNGKIYPATKGQRDLLFQKMKEAGYEWDLEVKELNKIEKKPTWGEEEKQLLLKDLCARLLYGVNCYVDDPLKGKLTVIPHSMLDMDGFECHTEDWEYEQFYSPDELTPYLRPLSNMTDEEIKELDNIEPSAIAYGFSSEIIRIVDDTNGLGIKLAQTVRVIDWLNAHHFDYLGLIDMGLALEAPEDMYKHE